MMNPDLFLGYLTQFVSLQLSLSDIWFRKNKESKDFRLLLDFPKRGMIDCLGIKWEVKRHGVGFTFEGEDGVVINMSNVVAEPHCFDVGRVYEYIKSLKLEKGVTFEDAEVLIQEFIRMGKIMAVESEFGGGLCRLVH